MDEEEGDDDKEDNDDSGSLDNPDKLAQQLETSEKLMKELTKSWEEKLLQAEAVKQERATVREA